MQFRGTNLSRGQTAEQRLLELLEFVTLQYEAGGSPRELAGLTGRTQTVLCTCQERRYAGEPPACQVALASPRTTPGARSRVATLTRSWQRRDPLAA